MRWIGWTRLAAGAALVTSVSLPVSVLADGQSVADPLARARAAYNNRQFDEAIAASQDALRVPVSSNAAAVVLGRAHLERYRRLSEAADLERARAALAQVHPDSLSPRDRIEFLMGLGVSLFLDGCTDGCFSAAAEFFDLAMARAPDAAEHEIMFEWWAGALDRQAQSGPDTDRAVIYRRILDRAEAERARSEDSTSAAYWIAAGARGTGDFERAWGASIAGWVRAKYLGPRGVALRTDLDRLVTLVVLPERARHLADADPRPTLAILQQQWAEIKAKYE